MSKETVAPVKVQSFDLKEVRLLPSRFRENMLRDSAWMASIDANRLLHSFRTNAGVYAGREGGYMTVKKLGGWKSLDCELRGHTTGHLLSAYSLMFAATGSEVFKLKGDSLVSGLAGERGVEGMQSPAPFSNPKLYNDYYTYDYHVPADLNVTLPIDPRRPERALQRQGTALRFTTTQGDVLRPLYDLHRQRYVVYWQITQPE